MKHDELVNEILKSVVEVIEENNETAPAIHEDTVIFGSDGVLDSLGLVSLVVKLEEIIEQVWKTDIQIVDSDTLLIEYNNPLKTPNSLADLITKKLHAK